MTASFKPKSNDTPNEQPPITMRPPTDEEISEALREFVRSGQPAAAPLRATLDKRAKSADGEALMRAVRAASRS